MLRIPRTGIENAKQGGYLASGSITQGLLPMKQLFPLAIVLTGLLLAVLPWDLIPLCLPYMTPEVFVGESVAASCRTTKGLSMILGLISVVCGLSALFSTKRKTLWSSLCIVALMAVGVFFIFLIWPKGYRSPIIPCRSLALPLTLSTGAFQFILALYGLISSRKAKFDDDLM